MRVAIVRVLLGATCASLVGCSFLPERDRFVASRTERPAPVIFDPATDTLAGDSITGIDELEGIWGFSFIEQSARIDEGLTVPLLYYSQFLKLNQDGGYEFVYQAYWGTRNLSDPNMRAVDVREVGQFNIAPNMLQLKPTRTLLTERQSGQLTQRVSGNEYREYLIALDGAFLNIAGRCASYQVEPVCSRARDVWYLLRLMLIDWPVPELTPLSTPPGQEGRTGNL